MVKAVCGEVIIDKGVDGVDLVEKPKSPGMKYKHYAPNADVILVEGSSIEDIVEKMKAEIENSGDKTIVLCSEETMSNFKNIDTMCLGSRNKPETFANKLFYAFRECDIKGYDTIILEGIEKEGIGLAVMNRATRAAHK